MNGWSAHLAFRSMTMLRGQLISLIYAKITTIPFTHSSESAGIALMSTDTQRIAETTHYLLIDVLPNLVQLAIAVYLLYSQLGVVCIAPVVVTVGKTLPCGSNQLILTSLNSLGVAFDSPCGPYQLATKEMARSNSAPYKSHIVYSWISQECEDAGPVECHASGYPGITRQ